MHSVIRTHEAEPDLLPRIRGSCRDLNEDITSCSCQEARTTCQTTNESCGTIADRQQSCPAQKLPCRFKLLHE